MMRLNVKKINLLNRFSFLKEKIGSCDLLKGLLIAIVFHAALFALFHIRSKKDPNLLPILTPIAVEVDLKCGKQGKGDAAALIYLPEEYIVRPSFLDLPSSQLYFEKQKTPYTIKLSENHEVEKIEYEPCFFEEVLFDCD